MKTSTTYFSTRTQIVKHIYLKKLPAVSRILCIAAVVLFTTLISSTNAFSQSCQDNNIGFNTDTTLNTLSICAGGTGVSINGFAPATTPTYSWEVASNSAGPFTTVSSDINNNVWSISSDYYNTPGTYYFRRVVSTSDACDGYSDTVELIVNALPTLTGASQSAPVCDGLSAIINLAGLPVNNTFSILYTVNGGAPQSATGVVSDGSGNASFNSIALNTSNNGQILQITSVTNTGSTPNCAATFTTDIILIVNAIPATPAAGNDGPVCVGSTLNLNTTLVSGATYNWTGPNSFISSVQNPVVPGVTSAVAGLYNLTVTVSGCTSATGSTNVVVNDNSTITLTSAGSTTNQSLCINTPITNIVYNVGGDGTGAVASGLPGGVTGSYSAGVFTISGTPTIGGTFNYTVTTTGPCTNPSLVGTITINDNSIITLSSAGGTTSQALCINTPVTDISYNIGGSGTGATVTGLPAGVNGVFSAGVFTISGTPTANGTFNYMVTTVGPCSNSALGGSIIVSANNSVTLSSAAGTDAQTICINTPVTNINYATTGATGATFSGLPAGVTGNWAGNVVTISGIPTASGAFPYTVTTTGGCTTPAVTASGNITVTANNTITLSSAAGTTTQAICINTPVTSITYSTTGATGATFSGLPAGVTGNWAGNVATISGTPTASGTFNYTVTTTGGCVTPAVTATGTITVTANNTITRISAAATTTQTICINTAIANIIYSTTGATGATFSGLPAGVTGNWAGNVVTISGTPTASGAFPYTVTTTGGCTTPAVTASGNITVTANNTITLSSAAGTTTQAICINTPVTSITYSTTGATGATFSGLPAGVTGNWAGNVATISGTPTASGTFNYTVTTTGGCVTPAVTATGTITVTANNTIALSSAAGTIAQTKCINTPITNITYATTGATGATVTNLPAGVTGAWAGNVVTISGTPIVAGAALTYTVTLTGGCGLVTTTGTIAVTANNTVTLSSAVGTDAQTKCINTPITTINYATTGASGATVTNLPAGVTGVWAGNVVTISGTPTVAGAALTYTVTLTGGCGVVTTTGTIAVIANNTVTRTSVAATTAQTVCISSPIANITYATTGATGATVTNLPAGVTGVWAGNIVTISGTPTVAGAALTYTVTLTGGCGLVTTTGTIAVTANNTIARTSAVGTDAQTKCINTPITNITYSTTGASGATVTNLPAGVTGVWAGNIVTISGTPTVAGAALTYTVTLTGGCGVVTTTGTIAVTANNTIARTSAVGTDAQTKCINTPITTINYATTGASGATVTNLPAGVTGVWAGNVVTISGTPTVAGAALTYTVTLTGGCGLITTTGTIAVTANNTVTRTSVVATTAQTVCINTPIANITYSTTGATGATVTNLPAGVTGVWAGNVVTISGTPTVAGAALTYTVTLTGGCGLVTTTGTIAVTANNTIARTSAVGTDAQTKCINTPITNITYSTTGASGATVTNLPAGVTGVWAGNVVTISGTPTVAGAALTYTVTLTGGCGLVTTTGTLTVNPSPVITGTFNVCAGLTTSLVGSATAAASSPWVSGTPAVATVNSSGLVTGVTAGTSVITYTNTNSCATTATITVNALPIITSVVATPAAICLGSSSNLLVTSPAGAPTTIVNYDFNSGASYGGLAPSLAPSITSAVSSPNITFNLVTPGTNTLASFTNNPTAGNALNDQNPSGSWVFTLGGASLPTYSNFKIYFQAQRANGGDNTINVSFSKDGGASVTVGTVNLTGSGTWFEAPFTFAASANNPTSTLAVTLAVGNGGTGDVKIDNFQVQATASTNSYSWSASPSGATAGLPGTAASSLASNNNISVSPTVNTNYTVTATSGAGCTSQSSVLVTVNPKPVANAITGAAAVCIGSTIALNSNATGAATLTYTWASSNNGLATVTNAGVVTGVAAGTPNITYTVTDGNSCASTSTAYSVTVNARPVATFTTAPGAAPCASTNVTYTTQAGQSNYIWTVPGVAGTDYTIISGGTGSGSNTVTLQWLTTGSKTVTVNYSNSNSCTSASAASNTITVNARPTATFTTQPAAFVCASNAVNTNNITYTTQASQSNYIWNVPGIPGTDYTIVSGGIGTTSSTVTLRWLTTGSKTVTVNYNNASGCTALTAASNTTTVNSLPVVNTSAASVCVASTITATPNIGGTWVSSNNAVATITNAGLITGVSPGTVTFTFTLTATGCSTTTPTVTVNALPVVAAISGSTTAICVNDIALFTNATAGGVWSVTNGTGAASVDASGLVTGSSAGSVTLVYTFNNGTCTNTATLPLTINAIPFVAPMAGGAASACVNATTPAFTDATPGGIWSIINGSGSASISAGGVVTGLTAGNVTVVYTIDNGTCSNEDARSLTINPLPPVAAIGGGALSVCVNSTTPAFTDATAGGVWSITNGTGTAIISAAGIVTGLTAGTVTVAYTINNGTCSNTATKALTINALPFIASIGGGSATVCINSTTPAFTNATAGGVWSITNGTGTASISAGGIVTGLTTGTVTVVYTVTNGTCADQVTTSLTVNTLPTAGAITGANTVCAGSTINLTSNASGTGGLSYTWFSSNTSAATVINTGVVTGVSAGTSNITYTAGDGNGCSATSPVFAVTVRARPSANITSSNTAICDGSAVSITGTVTANGPWTLTLSNGATANGTGNGSFNISISPTVSATYTVASLTDANCTSIAGDLTGSTVITVNEPVVITTQPALSQTGCSGSSISITVSATGTGLTYQWRKGVTALTNGGNISGANTATLVINPLALSDAATDYNVVITGAAPCAPVTSNNASLLVNQAIAITTQPVTQTLCSGSDVTFTVAATGSGLNYQWRKNGSPLTDGGNISGSNTTVLTITNTSSSDAATYSVVVSGLTPCAPVTSANAVLTVNVAVAITTQPADDAVCATLPVTFTVTATGSGLTYQWYKGTAPGTLITNNANISGATTANLHFNQANIADINDYYVVITGLAPCAPVQSDYAHLNVDRTITIVTQPAPQTICIGDDATFSVYATSGGDPLLYQWRKNGVDIPGAVDTFLTITGTTAGDAGNYDVVITGLAGCITSFSAIRSLTLNPLSVGGTVNSSTAVCVGVNSGTLILTGKTGNVIRWEFSTDGGGVWSPIANTTTSQTYTNLSVETMYRAVVQSGVCAPDNSVPATISLHPVPDATPTPASQTICSGFSITTIALTGSVPSTTYTWTRNNTGTVTGIAANGTGNIAGTLTNTTLAPITVTFTITPSANGCAGTPATATVLVNPSPNAIATPSAQTVCSGSAITTIVLTSSVPSTTFAWTRNNNAAVTGITASGNGDISGTLTNNTNAPVTVTFTITPTAAGCSPGTPTTATVVVNPTPNAVASPANQTVCSGLPINSIVLSSAVSGTTYTWTRDNAGTVTGIAASGSGNITGTLTNTTLAPITVTFTITPSANGCDGTPITATVLVNPSPDAVATPSSQSICSGSAITTIVLNGTVPSIYNWTRNNTGTVTGIAASGSGNISGSLTNTTNAPITVTFTITPTASSCPGTPITATVVVNPAPTAVATPSSQSLCSAVSITTIALTSNVASATFNWTRNNTGTITGIAASGSGDISGTLTNTTNVLTTVTFTITPIVNSCPGTPITATVAVKPTPTISATNSIQTLCSGVAITTATISNPNAVTGTTFSWTRDNTTNLTGIAASGSGTTISGTLTNNTSTQQVTVFTVTATSGGCASSTTVTVTVNPKPVMTSAASAKICNNSPVSIPLTSNIASAYTWVAANNANTTGESITVQTTSTLSNTLVNTSAVSQLTPRQNVIYTVTPTATATGCVGVAQTVTVTVNPSYNISFFEYPQDDNLSTICDGDEVGGGGQNDMDLIEGQYAGSTLLWQYSIGSNSGPWSTTPGPHVNGQINGIHDTLPDPPSIFSPMGNYYFRLLVDGCPSDIIQLTKTSTLTIDAGGPNTTICETGAPAAITLSGASVGGTSSTTPGGTWSITTLSPDNGGANGTLSSNAFLSGAAIGNVTYTPPANYSGVITLTLVSNDPDSNGPCAALTDTRTITITQAPIIANPSFSICSGSNTNITLTSVIPSTYSWTVGTITGGITGASPTSGSGATINQVLSNPSAVTAGTVQYIVTPTPISASTCAAVTSSIIVTVTPLPAVTLASSLATICQGSPSTLTATNSGGTLNQIYSGSSGTINQLIADNSASAYTYPTITLAGSGGATLTAADVVQVKLNINHTYDSDLDIFLVDPSGTRAILLSSDNGGTANNYTNTIIRTGAATSITAGTAPFNGIFAPEGAIGTAPDRTGSATGTYNAVIPANALNSGGGAPIDGAWSLRVFDDQNNDFGTIVDWSLSITKSSGNYTSVFTGPATIGATTYSGANNSIANAVVTPSAGSQLYTVTTTDLRGCSNTATTTVTVNPPPALSGATQQATACAGSSAQINLTGLIAGSTSTISYKINAGATQNTSGVVADASGNASFNTIALTVGGTLQITTVQITSASPNCSASFTLNIPLTVNPTPTLTGATQSAAVCPASSAQINLTGLIANSTSTISYSINSVAQTPVTGVVANGSGNASFNTIALTVANNGQTLQVTGVTITSATPNCSQTFTRNVTLTVTLPSTLSSSLTPPTICSASAFSYTATSATAGATFGWTRAAIAGISQAAGSGSGNINEVLTNTTNAPVSVIYIYTTTASGCNNTPGQSVTVVVNPAPTLSAITQAAPVCVGAGAVINLTGLLPNTTSTISYTINNVGQPLITGLVSDASGNATFTSSALTLSNNGQILKVLSVSTSSYTPACAKTVNVITLLMVNAIPTLTGALQASTVCGTGSATVNLTGLVPNSINTISYTIAGAPQTPVTGVTANGSGNASFATGVLTTANNGQLLTITAIDNGGCSQPFSQSFTLAIGSVNTWLGINTNWFDPLNWCGGVPTLSTDVLIPGSLSNYPVLIAGGGNGNARNINIQNTASITVTGTKMQIAGTITNTGVFNSTAGTIELIGSTTAQSISGGLFLNRTVNSLIVSNPLGVNVSSVSNDTLNIIDSLAFGNVSNTVLSTGNNITLVSRASKTARVADITNGGANTGNSFTGKVLVERFIPERRSWRLMNVPIQSTGAPTFNASWQEGVVNPDYVYTNQLDPRPGFGMNISGSSPVLGFDPTPNNNPSIKYYNPVAASWIGIPNTLSSKVTDSAGYMVFVRGDRSTALYLNTAAPTSITVLRASGLLKTNNQISTIPAGVGPYTVVGNPYPSTIDLRKVSTSGAVNGVNYAVWDPALTGASGVGAFQYFTRTGGPGTDYLVFPGNSGPGGGSYGAAMSINNTVQSSQAFMVQNAGTGTVSINENAKVGGSTSLVFRPSGNPHSTVSLGHISTLFFAESKDAEPQLIDGALSLYNENYSNTVDLDDAKKLLNFSSENFGIDKNSDWLQIEKRTEITDADTIQYRMRFVKVKNYQLQISASNIATPGLTAFLEDKFLHTSTALDLNGTTVHRFAINTDSGAWNPSRFRIVFKSIVTLPVTFTTIKGYMSSDDINVDWNVEHELAIKNYELEKSADGIHFIKAYTEVNVQNNDRSAAYHWVDKNPIKGVNYYRVKSKGLDGTFKTSPVVKVMFEKLAGYITLYPNPLTDAKLNLYFVNQPAGVYKVTLLSNTGQLIASKRIVHTETTNAEHFKPDQALLHGNYLLEILKPDGSKQIISVVY